MRLVLVIMLVMVLGVIKLVMLFLVFNLVLVFLVIILLTHNALVFRAWVSGWRSIVSIASHAVVQN